MHGHRGAGRVTGVQAHGCMEGYRGAGTRVHGHRSAGRVTGLQVHKCTDTGVLGGLKGCRYTGAWTLGCREGYRGAGTRVHGHRGAGKEAFRVEETRVKLCILMKE